MIREIENNILFFDGCDTVGLAKKYGTPLYVMSETEITERFRELKKSFTEKYPGTRVAYAAKAFFPLAMAKIVMREDMCVDVVSGGELYTAVKAGFPAERIEFNGNNKTDEELEMALKYGVGRIIVDGLSEISRIEKICKAENKTANVLFRVTPGVDCHSHDYMVTAKTDSKFGIPMDEEVILPQIKAAMDSPYINLKGFHFHVGSQIFENTYHLLALDVVLDLVAKAKEKLGYVTQELNLGGGFGAVYIDEKRQPYEYFLAPMMERITAFFDEHVMDRPAVVIEPGRSIAAEAGISLYSIGEIKDIKDVRKYVSVDGGMTDNIRPALYGAEYDAVIANKAGRKKTEKVTVCGKCCESGDILIKDIEIAEPERNDVLAVFSTGAYGYTMASNYNKNPIPAVVLVSKGRDELIVKRQSYEDLIRNEVIPEYLKK